MAIRHHSPVAQDLAEAEQEVRHISDLPLDAVTGAISSGYGYGSIPINTIFSGMNIHLPAIFYVHQGYKVLTHCHIGSEVLDVVVSDFLEQIV